MKIAVIGSGVSGLAATWLLNEHSEHEVHLFEAADRAGGHTCTVSCPVGDAEILVDTGFFAFNPTASPNFTRFLQLCGDMTTLCPVEMTFSLSRDQGFFEWASCCLLGVFCHPPRLLDSRMWRLLYDIRRFNACARNVVVDHDSYPDDCSVAQYLARERYSDTFRDDYLIPLAATIWTTPPDMCLEFPIKTLVKVMSSHSLLQVMSKSSWFTIKGRSVQYVHAILGDLPEDQLHLSTPVQSVGSTPDDTVQVTTIHGETIIFDYAIMACHPNTTLELLQAGPGIAVEELEILGRYRWNRNDVALHSDTDLMPKSKSTWRSCNFLTSSEVDAGGTYKANANRLTLTYDMNILQHLPKDVYGPVLLTLNPPAAISRVNLAGHFEYDLPVLNAQALASNAEFETIQGTRGIFYAGAWLGNGFHEDGFTSGMRAARRIEGVRVPFEMKSTEQTVATVLEAYLFHLLEWRGMRRVFGMILGFFLTLVGKLCFVRMKHGRHE